MKHRILIVDDSPLVHQIYASELEEAGYKVSHAYDGITAINMAFTEMPDLILLDINMPKINGYQVCRLLKDHPSTRSVPIVIVTGQENPLGVEDPQKWSFQTGANGYMEKNAESNLVDLVRFYLTSSSRPSVPMKCPPMSEIEIMTALSQLLDKQLYNDVTRLRDLDDRKNAFVANVSHEFKSPLAIILSNLELICDSLGGAVSEQQNRMIQTAIRTVKRLNRLVVDMLDIAKIEANKVILKSENVDMEALVDEVIEAYAALIVEKNMEVKREFLPGLSPVMGDRDRLMQVVINLFNNSLKFTPDKGRIVLRLLPKPGVIRLEIADSGPGMEAKNLERIFDKFERITADKREGTGLGLPIARDIVVMHNGRVWVESETGKGSTFIVELPIKKSERMRRP